MKKIELIFLGIMIFTISISQISAKPITVDKLPSSTSEFIKLRNEIAKSPEGGAVTWLIAMLKYSQDQKMGLQFMTIALSRDNLQQGAVYKGYKPHRSFNYHLKRFRRSLYWPKAYVIGTNPKNGYKFNWPASFELTRNRYSGKESSGKIKVFVKTYGVRPRPMMLKRNNRGYWKAGGISSFFLGVQTPVKKVDDDL